MRLCDQMFDKITGNDCFPLYAKVRPTKNIGYLLELRTIT